MSIDWKIEIEKSESWPGKKECCVKYIDLAKQISDELMAYKSMWQAEFDLRKKASTKYRKQMDELAESLIVQVESSGNCTGGCCVRAKKALSSFHKFIKDEEEDR